MKDDAVDRLAAALGDRYLIEEELGRGASATVYLAQDLRHGRRVALKVLHAALGAALGSARFQHEIRTQARLHHPHILPLFDSGSTGERLYYTMPFVEQGSLRDRLKRTGPLSLEAVRQLGLEVASALGYAHAHGIVHRDLKPENIMLSQSGHAILADFGIAYAIESSSADGAGGGRITETGVTLGTPVYMSPEQAAGDEVVDGNTDQYALAAVLYEALAGTPPFTGANARAILARKLTERPPALRDRCPDIPPAVEQVVLRALDRQPAQRFETVEAFAQALAAAAVERKSRPRRLVLGLGVGLTLLGVAVAGLARDWGRPAPTATPAPRVLVVLPFTNLGAPADQYFADGLTEELTSRLAGLPGLRVIARTTAAHYGSRPASLRRLGSELGAGYVLEGSVRWERSSTGGPGRLRVTPQLIQVADESHRWAQVYEAELTEVFGVQSRIAEQVTQALDLALGAPTQAALAAGGTRQPEAYDFYLRGNDYLARSTAEADLRSAAGLYRQAVAVDPEFAEAQARLSRAHLEIYWHYYDHSEERLRLARQAAEAARRIAPDLPETHIALGYYHYWGELDYDAALREFETARRQQPSNADLLRAIGLVERRRGRWDQSVSRFIEGLRYDPRSGVRAFEVGDNYFSMRMFREAEQYFDRAIVLSPDWPNPYVYKAWLQLSWRGDLPRARAVLGQALNRLPPGRLAASLSTGDRISASLVTADSTFWPMIDALSLAEFPGDSARYHLLKAEAAHFRRTRAAERAQGDSARALLEVRLRAHRDDPKLLSALALAYTHMGRSADAIRAGERSVERLPLSLDAVSGPFLQSGLARVYMVAGRAEQAVVILARLLTIPTWISPAELRADPIWEPLRNHPEFRKLTDSLPAS
jgi:TolB-like protein/tRNA A-37 threonylcarbamoyl transferase component Bud32/Tfp pilus assembly protein PilF